MIFTVTATKHPEMPPGDIPPDPNPRLAELGRLSRLSQFEGVLLIVLGVLALSFPVIASAWVTLMVALAFLLGGLLGWIDNLRRARSMTRWHAFWRLVIATLFLVTGLWMLFQFKAGLVPAALQIKALATAIGIVFLAEGLVSTAVALTHRQVRGWGWGLANGSITLILGLLILTMSPPGLLSVIGLLVGISFIFSGFDLLRFGSRFHLPPAKSSEAPPDAAG